MRRESTKVWPVLIFAGLLVFALGAVLQLTPSSHYLAISLRWFGLLVLGMVGIRNRSLTYWIFFAMLFGLEIGL
ncbi:MAG TPA: hypothetical protein VGI13_04130, partial [Candidatus Acidoferrum sp.]